MARPTTGGRTPADTEVDGGHRGLHTDEIGGLAVLLGVVNPKNLLLVVSGGAAVAAVAPGETSAAWVATLVFAVVASIGAVTALVVYLAMGDQAARILDELKGWMIQSNAAIMAVLLLVIGAKMVGDAVSAL